jgi:hypothetical protein
VIPETIQIHEFVIQILGYDFPDTNPATLENNNLQKETNTLKAKVLKDTYIVSVLVYNNRSYYSI